MVLILQRSSHPLLFLPHSSSLFISPHLILVCRQDRKDNPAPPISRSLRNSRIQDYCEVAREGEECELGSSGVLLSPGALFPWTFSLWPCCVKVHRTFRNHLLHYLLTTIAKSSSLLGRYLLSNPKVLRVFA